MQNDLTFVLRYIMLLQYNNCCVLTKNMEHISSYLTCVLQNDCARPGYFWSTSHEPQADGGIGISPTGTSSICNPSHGFCTEGNTKLETS